MRTIKALVCAAALAAGIATSMAQSNVYSLNVVGYYNITCAAGSLQMIANQLNTTNNTLGALLPSPLPNSVVYKYSGGWVPYTFDPDDLTWYPDSAATMSVGEGVLFKSPLAQTLTFVGEVLQGQLQVSVPTTTLAGRASMVPQAGSVATDLGFPSYPNDVIYRYAGGWIPYTFDPDDLTFYPNEPIVAVGEGILVKKAVASIVTTWTRNFTVQ
jgi:hypothetical protein